MIMKALKTLTGRDLLLTLALRGSLLIGLLLVADWFIEFETSSFFLSISILAGIFCATSCFVFRLRTGMVALLSILFIFGMRFITRLPLYISMANHQALEISAWRDHLLMAVYVGSAALILTFLFWRFKWVLTLEALMLPIGSIVALAAHRHYRFDMIRSFDELTWRYEVSALTIYIIFGACLSILTIAYIVSAEALRFRLLAKLSEQTASARQTLNPLQRILSSSFIVLLMVAISWQVFLQHKDTLQSQLQNGVSDKAEKGLSPLNFHQSLGGTAQPSALVRLEGDYPANPFSPMLYLREAALSEFNGHEMVVSGPPYDEDVSDTNPDQHYKLDEVPEQFERTPLTQSIYLLTDHQLAFAVDFPLSINPLKLPKGMERFKKAYRAYSMAPAFALKDLENAKPGFKDWGSETWAHYLQPHTDSRYKEKALSIVGDETNQYAKIKKVIEFMNKTAIYTLRPNHDVSRDEDQTAAFLFGDMRGYCVHFAHATVYMLRALGVPARIGTGYLTDLSQSKDGHILLRMSDRHAWAEVAYDGYGWVPFDTQPEQVEIHAETPVDQNALEELMGLLEPGEEILPKDLELDPAFGKQEEHPLNITFNQTVKIAAVLLLLVLLIKCYLRYSWLLPANSRNKVIRGHRALRVYLRDLGLQRHSGETNLEFAKRISQRKALEINSTVSLLNKFKYSRPEAQPSLAASEAEASIWKDWDSFAHMPRWQRFLAFLNPRSLLVPLMRSK